MLLTDRLSHGFDGTTRSRGKTYYQQKRVRVLKRVPTGAEFSVLGEGDSYKVLLDWGTDDGKSLSMACSCPRYQDGVTCKHLWAAVLKLQEQPATILPGRGKLDVDEWDLDELQQCFGKPHTTADGGDDDDDDDLEYDDDFEDDDSSSSHFGKTKVPRVSAIMSELVRRGVSPTAAPGLPTSATGLIPAPVTPAVPAWLQQLSGVAAQQDSPVQRFHESTPKPEATEVWFLLDISESLRRQSLVLDLWSRPLDADATGEVAADQFFLSEHALSRVGAHEREVLVRLNQVNINTTEDIEYSGGNRYAYGYYGSPTYKPPTSRVVVPARWSDVVIEMLARTGRLNWRLSGKSQRRGQIEANDANWDDGPAQRLQLIVEPNAKKKHWTLRGVFRRDGQEPLPLENAVLAIFNQHLLFQDRVVRADMQGAKEWIDLLLRNNKVTVPFADRDQFVRELWGMPVRPDMVLPPELTLVEEATPPVPRLVTLPPKYPAVKKLAAKLQFQYGEQRVDIMSRSSSVVDVANNRFIPRDLEAERRWVGTLWPKDFSAITDISTGAHVEFPRAEFGRLVQDLMKEGWTVEADGRTIRSGGSFNVKVTSGVDWFDLEGSCDFGDGVSAGLPALLAAVRSGSKYVLLDDGSHGMLPEDWLKKYGGIAGLGDQQGDGTIRFKQSQALILDALLSGQDNAVFDERFAEYRNRLQSFKKIKKIKEPAGFGGTLREYQREGLGWLKFLQEFQIGGCLADDMGLGKTVQVIAMLDQRRRDVQDDPDRRPSLVVVPKSLIFNWREEAKRFAPELKIHNFTGKERDKSEDTINSADIVLTTYGTLKYDILQLKEIAWDYVILDEATAIKNSDSHNAKACRLLNSRHRLAMSGTPIENHLGELWSLFEFLNPGLLGRSTAFGLVSRNATEDLDAVKLLNRAIAPFMLRRTKGQVLKELPEKTEQTLFCELPPKHRKLYDELREHYRVMLAEKIENQGLAKTKIHVLEALLRLRQAACHPGLLDKTMAKQSSAKLDALFEQLDEVLAEGHKVLVFSQFTSLLAIVKQHMAKKKIKFEYLDGQTNNRQACVERFQNDKTCPVFLISLKAGGHGLNLTAADYVFILDPWWNPAVESQAIDRAHRIGQTKRVFAYRFIAKDTVEEKVLQLQKSKQQLAEAIISANGSLLTKLTAEDLQLLLT